MSSINLVFIFIYIFIYLAPILTLLCPEDITWVNNGSFSIKAYILGEEDSSHLDILSSEPIDCLNCYFSSCFTNLFSYHQLSSLLDGFQIQAKWFYDLYIWIFTNTSTVVLNPDTIMVSILLEVLSCTDEIAHNLFKCYCTPYAEFPFRLFFLNHCTSNPSSFPKPNQPIRASFGYKQTNRDRTPTLTYDECIINIFDGG